MSTPPRKTSFTDQDALLFHSQGKPGKLEVAATKPMATQRDLSLAYSPGVAVPVQAIADDPGSAYDYTNKGNMVGVVSNGTAILGMGNLGALASKPVMEGKSVLFKRFADVDGIDILVDTEDVDEFVNCVRFLGSSFGGINLEDIRAPECFHIEAQLRELLDIPVFHDDQHGTAIIVAAGFINALHLTNRDIGSTNLVCNGAGAAGIASLELLIAMGLKRENIIMCDSRGVIHKGREKGMNEWKERFAADTNMRTLDEAMEGADTFFGLSVKGAVTKGMVASMANKPLIFAMANPDPEITPEEVSEVRDDAIMATGRSDYPNQINNVLGFPYIFRGALDVRATAINDAMKIAAAEALAELARADVPDQVAAAYSGHRPRYGPDYIIPVPFDPRLIHFVPPAVAKAAMDSGVAQRPIVDLDAYVTRLKGRLDPVSGIMETIFTKVRRSPKRVVFAEGEEEQVIRAANAFLDEGFGQPVLIGREKEIAKGFKKLGIPQRDSIEIHKPGSSDRDAEYADFLFERLQRRGYVFRDCRRMVNNDRNVYATTMVAMGHADAMVTGVTRSWSVAYEDVAKVLDPNPGRCAIGISISMCRDRAVLIADGSVHNQPTSQELADIACEAAGVARRLGYEPRVAMLSFSTFGSPIGERSDAVREAVEHLDRRDVDFEYDGEMAADVALNPNTMALYPFCRLSGPANVLIMPGFHSASISTKMLQELGDATVVGPLLVGLSKPVQIAALGASDEAILNMAALAAFDITAQSSG